MKGSQRWKGSHSRSNFLDFTEKEKEKMAEDELRKLQQHFRIMVEKRKSFGVKVLQQMYHQEKQIHSLKQEHDEMALLLSLAKSPRNMMLDVRNCMELKYLLQTRDEYDSLIKATKALIAELDEKVMEMENKIEKQNLVVAKVKEANDSKELQKKIQRLETRLNHVTVHFDTVLTMNTKLREEIETLRVQKAVFDNNYIKLHKKFDQQKRMMENATEQSSQAYDQRVEALDRISAMKDKHYKDTVQFNIEFRELERIFDHETKLKSFMVVKLVDRSDFEDQVKREEAFKASKRAKKSKGESFESYEVSYIRLLQMTENGDIGQLVEEFIEKEEKNFAYFSYATELNNEMERLQKRIEDIQSEILHLKSQQKDAKTTSHVSLKELERKLKKTSEEADLYELTCKEGGKVLDQLKSAVAFLFKQTNCDATKIKEQLGESDEITDLNLMQYFGVIEKKTNDLLLTEAFVRYKEFEGERDSSPLLNPFLGGSSLLKSMDSNKMALPPPPIEHVADILEDFDNPLDHDSIRDLILGNSETDQSRSSSVDKGQKREVSF
ncbi:PREDICTED: coiled-coil domain-containing protein 63 [Gavialis gangeticus]|uniref:coiled-coil domain-containing protein 63 n=1 Tax=Gavialis gangeticus TaxID=94835 RepID=UPI00092F944D|nr:PREDICTED: coiled-coil domain-containing protein 63 [Gavialis gangeticus]